MTPTGMAASGGAAWQYFEEHRKGALGSSKLADMVVLDRDPLKVELRTS